MATIWQKAFSRIFWRNRPNTTTPVGESKLLPMDASIDEIDNRVVTLQQTKAEQSDFLTSIKNIQFNRQTGVFTITKFNDTTFTIDTDLEKIAVNFDYDDDPTSAHYQQIILTLIDGTVKYIDLSALITQYEFIDTATIHFSVGNDGKISATVIDGSITESKLQPNYLGDIRVETAKSQQYMTNAQTAQNAAETAQGLAEDAQEAAETAQGLAETAQTGAEDARDRANASATSASTSETNALASATQAETYATNASTSASNASTSENNASTYATNASNSASSAGQSATSASDSAQDSEAWAVGKRNGVDVPSTDPRYHNNSKYYAQQAEASLTNTVRSFKGRTGAVIPSNDDYDISQIAPLTGATAGQVPVVRNVGTEQEPVYRFAMGDVSVSGIGELNYIMLSNLYQITMNSKFKMVEGAYLAVKFNTDFYVSSVASIDVYVVGSGDYVLRPFMSSSDFSIKAGTVAILVYDGTYLQVVGLSSSGGHTIQNSAGTDLPQEDKMQFADSFVSDDSTNGRTVVENIKEVSPADYDSTTDEGIIVTDDGDDALIGAVSDDYVEVTADGVKTYTNLLNELFALVDMTKINQDSVLVEWYGDDYYYPFAIDTIKSNILSFHSISGNSSNFNVFRRTLSASSSTATHNYMENGGNNTYADDSSYQVGNGGKFILYYGNKKATVDLQTTANRCLMSDGVTSVEEAIDKLNPSALTYTADGEKTYRQCLVSLKTKIDTSKINYRSVILIDGTVHKCIDAGRFRFSRTYATTAGLMTYSPFLTGACSYIVSTGTTCNDDSNEIPPNGTVFAFYYN